MGVETWPVIENYVETEPVTTDNFVEWKWLTDCLFHLEEPAKKLNLTPLDAFCNNSRQAAIESLGEEEVEEMEADAEFKDGSFYLCGGLLWTLERVWFSPDDALKTVRGLTQLLRTQPKSVISDETDEGDVEGFLYILPELEKVLIKAQQMGKCFHFRSLV